MDKEGSLLSFEASASKGVIFGLADLLTEKYGMPLITDTQTENGLGTKFDKKTFVWIDPHGTRITVESIYDKIDHGRVSIESASLIKFQESVSGVVKEAYRSRL